jgi:hypothetical protein
LPFSKMRVGNCHYRRRRCRASFRAVILYGIADSFTGDIEDWYSSREEAEAVLRGILRDEPGFEGELWVAALEFEQSAN